MSTSDADEAIRQAFELSTKALRNGGELDISDESVQMLLTIGAKALARKFTDEDRYFPPFVKGEIITATEAVVTITEFMHAADLNTFDLGMWMSRPRPTPGDDS
jgi:hypothetical protein